MFDVLKIAIILYTTGFIFVSGRLLQCRQCEGHHFLDDCPLVTCQSDEFCYVSDRINSQARTEHTAKCLRDITCRTLTQMIFEIMSSDTAVGRKRNIHSCDICCGDDYCNTKSCHQLKHEMYRLYQNNQLNMTTLTAV